MQEVLDDFRRCGSNYQRLVASYSGQMDDIVKQFGGISDVPATANHPYWELQRKLNTAHAMHSQGLFPEEVVSTDGTNTSSEPASN